MTHAPAESFPLYWPEHWTRTPGVKRKGASYQVGRGQAIKELHEELHRWKARHIVISTNLPMRRDGLPRAATAEPMDPGVPPAKSKIK